MEGTGINREHKSSLFAYLFGREETKERTLSLYNSLNGTDYTNLNDITITTIEDVVYMGMKNDLSYIVRMSLYSTLNVTEHQSSDNPNMPIRELMYAARLYDKYLKAAGRTPYSSSIIPLPIPKLVVLYNGTTDIPDESVLRLSNAFRAEIRQNLNNKYGNPEELEQAVDTALEKASPDIEVSVHVKNVNYGHSEKILSVCKPLNEYAWLIATVRKLMVDGATAEEAFNSAIDSMPDGFSIKEQLLLHKAEVAGMWINEYNEQETMKLLKDEYLQQGRQEGRREGKQEGESMLASLINTLLSLGRNDDIPRVTTDPSFRENLYIQFGLKKPL